ncbi:MAG: hypothetical protein M3N68_03420, partial [Actinomycetota bacterium]|nr:hypothetical protein [Actinomycetota bacterium]
ENPARALGHLVPDLLLAVGTGGAGVWARRAGIEAKALSKLSRSPRPARIAHLAEASAQRYLSRLEQSVPGAHFLARHGAQTTLEQQFRRATTGMTPDGVQHIPRNASRFLTHRDQLEVIQRAQDIHRQTGAPVGRPPVG